MSLLKDIIAEATAKATDVPRMLRLCMVLASKLKHEPLRAWVKHELEGYPPDAVLPDYRVLMVRNKGQFMGVNYQGVLDIPVSILPASLQSAYSNAELRQSIGECSHLASASTDKDAGVLIPWPVELALKYASGYVSHGQCLKAWKELSSAELAGMMDKVKTKVLAFALDIEAEAPDAGEIEGPDNPPMKEERVSQIFNTNIQGNIQNYSAGGSKISQTAIGSIQVGDVDTLLATLKAAGMSEPDLESLHTAIVQDKEQGATGMGAAVKGWLADLTIKAGQGIAGIGPEVVTGVVVQAILAFLGVSA